MPSTFFGLTIASSGLNASQLGINTTGHNISNVNTKGYSRQQIIQAASTPIRSYTSNGMLGSGVDVNGIEQVRDVYYDKKYWRNQTEKGRYEALDSYMKQVENYFNETSLEGFTTEYDNVFNALESLKNNSADTSTRMAFLQSAVSFSEYINTLYQNVSNVQDDLNQQVKVKVDQINNIAEQIASLNKQINTVEMNGGNANDLRDSRALLIDTLSTIVPTDVTEKSLGNGVTTYDVKISGQTLVSTYDYYTLMTEAREDKTNVSDIEGLYDIKWSNGNSFNMYSSSIGGELKALIDVRDGCNGGYEAEDPDDPSKLAIVYDPNKLLTSYKGIPYYLNQLNQFAAEFAKLFNDTMKEGQNLYDEDCDVDLFVTRYEGDATITASGLKVNDALLDDPKLMATGTNMANGQENTDIIDNMLLIKKNTFLNSNSPSGYLESIVAQIATDTKIASSFSTNYANMANIINKQRMSISAADEDEEALNLVKYQNAYNLASKMVQVMTEMYDRLILQTGV